MPNRTGDDDARLPAAVREEWGRELSALGRDAGSMEETAARIARHLYDRFRTDANDVPGAAAEPRRVCALVRLYKTHLYRDLPADLMDFVDRAMSGPPPDMRLKCLTLLGTAGDDPAWNERTASRGHQAIPLTDADLVGGRIPMVARLVEQMGMDPGRLLATPDASFTLPAGDAPGDARRTASPERKYDVFYVPEADGSPYIPAQDFVTRYGIRSVVGFGGVLPSGDLFAVILFCRISLARETAAHFAGLALSVKIALLPFTFRNVFAPPVVPG